MTTERLEEIEDLCKSNEANTSTCEIIRELIGAVRALTQSLAEASREINNIDAVLARRPALADCKTRTDKIEKAIVIAKKSDELQSQLTASHAENARLRSALIKVVETIPDRFPVPADYSIFIALRMSAKEALTPTMPNPIEQELTELRRDKQTLIDAAWHFHNCKYCGEGSSCDDGAAHGERLLAISDSASKEAKV